MRLTSRRWTIARSNCAPRIPRAVSRPRRGPSDQVCPDLQEPWRTSQRVLLSPAPQIIGIPIVPLRILEEREGMRAHAEQREGECLFCEILRRELASGRRVVAENGGFVALEPYAARFPFETWLLPKVHARAFDTLSDADRGGLARILKDVLGRMYRMLDDPSFNYYIHTAPVREPRARSTGTSRSRRTSPRSRALTEAPGSTSIRSCLKMR